MSEELIPLTDLPGLLAKRGIVVSYSAVWRRAVDGVLPSIRIGKAIVIRLADLPEIAEACRAQAAEPLDRGGRPKRRGSAHLTAARPTANSEAHPAN